jgi:hypothetical protein
MNEAGGKFESSRSVSGEGQRTLRRQKIRKSREKSLVQPLKAQRLRTSAVAPPRHSSNTKVSNRKDQGPNLAANLLFLCDKVVPLSDRYELA